MKELEQKLEAEIIGEVFGAKVIRLSDATRILEQEKERIIKIVETQLNGYHKKLEKDEIYACQEILEAIKGANHD